MQLFVLTAHCQSRVHCKACRNLEGGRKWRASIMKAYAVPDNIVDFECPYGMPWGPVETPAQQPVSHTASISHTEQVTQTSQPKQAIPRQQKRGCGCSRNK